MGLCMPLESRNWAQWRIKVRPASGSYRAWQRPEETVFVESYRSYLEEHFTHAESAAIGPDEEPCGRETRGVLRAAPARIEAERIVGKETMWLPQQLPGVAITRGGTINVGATGLGQAEAQQVAKGEGNLALAMRIDIVFLDVCIGAMP